MIVTKIVTAIVTDQALDLIIWETVEIAHHMQVNAHTTHIFLFIVRVIVLYWL